MLARVLINNSMRARQKLLQLRQNVAFNDFNNIHALDTLVTFNQTDFIFSQLRSRTKSISIASGVNVNATFFSLSFSFSTLVIAKKLAKSEIFYGLRYDGQIRSELRFRSVIN